MNSGIFDGMGEAIIEMFAGKSLRRKKVEKVPQRLKPPLGRPLTQR
jgi:hypothetical protein